jgi:hypothetical protein
MRNDVSGSLPLSASNLYWRRASAEIPWNQAGMRLFTIAEHRLLASNPSGVRSAVLAKHAVLFIGLLCLMIPCGCSRDRGTEQSLAPERLQRGPLWETAPTPNREASQPASRERVSLNPAIVHAFGKPLGDGYLPGSTYRNQEDTPSTRGPGLELQVRVP